MKNRSSNINASMSSTGEFKQSRISPFLLLNISMYTLAAICFMIYTTELNYAHAVGDDDLGSASSSLDASVTVGTACNFSSNVDNQHHATITNGVNSTDIGKTTLNVTCNDQGGYAVYAIGYTNDEYGNTSLKSSISDDYNISTGISTSGNTSNWSMKLATVPGTTTATIENNYNNYHTVPDDYTKVATLNTITDPNSSTTGSSVSTTYQTYISPTQPAGTYTGKVKYTLVHPGSAAKPIIPDISKLTYMQDFARLSSDDLLRLKNSMNPETTYTLRDQRDNQEYTIAKLKDNKIWMTQNLDLAGGTALYSETSNVPEGYSESNNSPYYTLPNSSTSGFSSGSVDYTYNVPYSQTDRTSCAESHPCYSYYSWLAVTALSGKNTTSEDTDAPYSICPKGWRLPRSRSAIASDSSDFYQLAVAYGMDPTFNGDYSTETGANFYNQAGPGTVPNFLLTGYYSDNGLFNGGESGYYWSSTSSSGRTYALRLSFDSLGLATAGDVHREYGSAIRCLAE